MSKLLNVLTSGLVALTATNTTLAAWPDDQPVRVIVPQPAGGTNDTAARLIGTELGKALKQSVVIENRPGASGAIGSQAIIQSNADGYTLGIASDSSTIVGAVRPSIAWKFNRDLVGVAKVADQPICITVSKKEPYQTLDSLLNAARIAPNTIAFASSGAGSSQHLVGEWLSKVAKVKLIHVPYKGGGQAITDLVGGQVPMAVLGCVPVLAQKKAGTVRVLAITASERNPALPDVPTLTELGYPEISLAQWVGFVAPRNVPAPIVDRISTEISKILSKPEIRQKLLDNGLDPRPMASAEFDVFLGKTVADWKNIVDELNIRLE